MNTRKRSFVAILLGKVLFDFDGHRRPSFLFGEVLLNFDGHRGPSFLFGKVHSISMGTDARRCR